MSDKGRVSKLAEKRCNFGPIPPPASSTADEERAAWIREIQAQGSAADVAAECARNAGRDSRTRRPKRDESGD